MSVTAQNDEDWGDNDQNKRAELIEDAKESRSVFKQKNDELEDLFQSSYGYAIFPNVGSGAYILGGAAGNGVVYEQGELVGFAELRQIDIGLQVGGQAYRQVIFFKNKAALDEFKSGDYEIGGNISAVVIEQGEARSIRFQDGIAVATMPKAGAMVELSVGGQKFEYADDWKNK
ncbi:hypothetical protein E0K83_04200 [Gramella sp. BOM4]|nr:hypothetical protein [Christiangramia bathymodioli]